MENVSFVPKFMMMTNFVNQIHFTGTTFFNEFRFLEIKTVLFLLFSGSCLFGQGSLQFNQVLTYSGVAACNGQTWSTPSLTVPGSKVWKLSAVVLSNAVGYIITHNGNQINVVSNLNYSMPVWFKDGDVISFGVGPTPSGSNISCTNGMLVSIIEFNVIP